METIQLIATTRTETGKALLKLRAAGFIPAVRYGHDEKPVSLSVPALDFSKAYRMAGESTLVELILDGKKGSNVLIHDVQTDPLSGRFTHIDFYQVNMSEEIETDVPLEYIGESEAVKAHGGVLVRSLDEVKIKCLPKDLPHSLTVDIARLKTFDDHIKVADLVLPKGVEMLEALDTTIALVTPPRTEAEMSALNEKVEMDVTKVEGVVKETPEAAPAEGEAKKEEKK